MLEGLGMTVLLSAMDARWPRPKGGAQRRVGSQH